MSIRMLDSDGLLANHRAQLRSWMFSFEPGQLLTQGEDLNCGSRRLRKKTWTAARIAEINSSTNPVCSKREHKIHR